MPEEKGVALAYCSIHGNTEKAALLLRDFLAGAGETVEVFDLCRCDMSAAVAAAFNAARPPYSDQWSAEAARASVALTAVRDYLS